MSIEMIWRGDKINNHSSRAYGGRTYVPMVIGDHISAGSMSSMYAWFCNPISKASSHFGVGRYGEIHQYVRIGRAAWTQGITTEAIPRATAAIVRQMRVNPNLYCVGIEHEGYGSEGGDGELTELQFWSSAWLHKYIQAEVHREFGFRIPLNAGNVVGHYQIDPVRKPLCPGPRFPWSRLYAELAIADGMELDEYEERVEYQRGRAGEFAKAYAVAGRVRDLLDKVRSDPRWGPVATSKLLALAPIAPAIEYAAYVPGDVTAAGIAGRVLQLYDTLAAGGKYAGEALRKLLIVHTEMTTRGLL